MKNNKKIRKAVASMLVCAVTCSVLPASESFAARNNNNWSNPSVATGGAVRPVSSGAVSGKRPETVSHGAIWNNPDIQGDWDFSDIFSWMDGINWDDANWGNVQDMFPVTGGAIGGRLPQEDWQNIDWPDIHQRPVTTGGAIDGEQPENTDKHQKPVTTGGAIDGEKPENTNKPQRPVTTGGAIDGEKPENTNKPQRPVTTGGAIDADQPNREDGENQKPSDETQKPTTPDNGKENETKNPATPDNGKENETQNPTIPDNGKENETQNPTTPDNGKEQKTEESAVPTDTVADGEVKETTNKKAKIKVTVTSKKVKKGKKYTIKYSIVSGSGKVTFKSSNKKVATVSSKGVVTAKKKGTATITVKIANGNTKKVKITVK